MDFDFFKNVMLFGGMDEEEIAAALTSLRAESRDYKKSELIFHTGAVTDRMGLVLEGSVTIENCDIWGNRAILSHVGRGQFFAETYAFLEDEPMLVDVSANENCKILFLNCRGIRRPEGNSEPWRAKLISNLLTISSHKNLTLSQRIFNTAPKTVRGRVMAYLNSVSLQKNSRQFDIPFDRQQLADYLNLDRSALSAELGRMQRDGLISTRKNHFIIHDPA